MRKRPAFSREPRQTEPRQSDILLKLRADFRQADWLEGTRHQSSIRVGWLGYLAEALPRHHVALGNEHTGEEAR